MTSTVDAPPQRSLRGLVGVLCAQAMAFTGIRLSALALPWFVLTSTGSAITTGVAVFVQMGAYAVVQALAGPLIDRLGPRRISVTGDLVAMTAMAAIPLLHAAGALPFVALLPLVAVFGAADGPATAAKSVLIPEVTAAAKVPLERGTGLSGSIERLSSTVGPGIGGVVVAAFGGVNALWITAALLGVSTVVIAATTSRPEPVAIDGETPGYLAQLRAGAAFLGKDRLLRSIVGMVAVTNLLDAAWVSVLLPVWAKETGHGPEVVGLVISVMSAAAILTSLVAAAIGHRLPRRWVALAGFVIGGAPRFIVLAIGAPLWVIVVVYAVGGLGSGVLNPILGAVMFERVPRELFGRTRTLISSVAFSGIPFGGLVAGGLIAAAGLPPALLVCGGLYFVATLLPGLRPEWAEMDRDRRRAAKGAAKD